MTWDRTDAENLESAIERRLGQTMVSGGVRPLPNRGPARKANGSGTGLFLVKPSVTASDRKRLLKPDNANERATQPQRGAGAGSRGRLLRMPLLPKQTRQQRWMKFTAAMRSLLKFGRAGFVWLQDV